MRADRLVQLMLILQEREPITAAELARRLEVSVRTVHRDLLALSASGVPVFARRGPHGGVRLMEGWRTRLTGLTEREVEALAALGPPGALEDVGLSDALKSALVKLAASLPSMQRPAAEHARQRLHVDATPFFGARERVPHLGALRDAVWQDRRLRIRYRDFEGRPTRRVIDPYGLVIKLDRWYLVAGGAKGPAVFRGARIEHARILDERFERPAGFDLPSFWKEWSRRFSAGERPRFVVTLRANEAGREALAALRPDADRDRLREARCGRDGTAVVEIDFERESIAISQLALAGAGIKVLAPAPLRERLAALGRALAATYGGRARLAKPTRRVSSSRA